jgi:hypothetical protein
MKTLAVARLAGLLAIVALAAYGGMDTTASRDLSKRKTVADDAGNLHVPDTYRTTYELLGSWAVAADQGQGSQQLHVVYASPGTIAAYRTDGRFPDGAVLVKEVFKAANDDRHCQPCRDFEGLVRHDEGQQGSPCRQ